VAKKQAASVDAPGAAASGGDDPWPAGLAPDVEDVELAMAQTLPAHGDQAVREVERLYLDSIAAAKRTIYIENQYLSYQHIGEALKDRLKVQDGPEVVIVLPEKTGAGWSSTPWMCSANGF
jgi:phosphatidylserine/phosphatidylglycerophosphate/cardiolipin synthase-like enzyme